MTDPMVAPLLRRWATLLRTRRGDGSWVDTPVNAAVAGDRVVFGTAATTAKVRRLRRHPEVEIAPCTVRGRPVGEFLRATARPLDGAEAAAAARCLRRRFPVSYRILAPIEIRRRGTRYVFYELADLRPAE
ncbi:hypothetical protein SAMN05421810_11490 [Amycolatopsis arida]|uniref:Pyridoxamine 5'-phosphate oxidase putative domain-containing protein n=1 Tax=Amycolatopsis arida TaxID=587909 RepID=A0A1I6ATH6_9PSEU|nr:PPOX class F420-dependent oxidoreductase [Amycolatopsis arida]TDX97533.1 hypothetical protein CLV69_102637 [Amycolatopsis arida]SFQ71956.1 hypothetical protein SAMN05421810_11490 [Amycolatopsis arida]